MDDLRTRLRAEPAAIHYDVARGLQRHRALVEAGAPLPAWAHRPPRPRWPRLLLISLPFLALTLTWTSPPTEPPTPETARPTQAPLPTVQRPRVAPVVERASERPPSRANDAPATAEEPSAPRPRVEPEPARRPARVRPHGPPSPGTAVERSHDAVRSAGTPSVVAPEDNRELAQLVAAERALASDPVRALSLVRDGELTFRNGYFAQERRYVEVSALFALGRLGEAHAQALAFLRDYPSSPYRQRIEREQLRHPQP